MPTELHLALQRHYAGEDGLVEAELGGYKVDVLRDGVIYEIQTGTFSAIRKKLEDLSKTHRVVLIYPIARQKIIVRLDPTSGEELSARRSPTGDGSAFWLPWEILRRFGVCYRCLRYRNVS